jgi:hypothetical protein
MIHKDARNTVVTVEEQRQLPRSSHGAAHGCIPEAFTAKTFLPRIDIPEFP